MRKDTARPVVALCLTLFASLAFAPRAGAQFTLPPNFVDEQIVGGLTKPVGMALMLDGRFMAVGRTTGGGRRVVNGAVAGIGPVRTVGNVNIGGNEQGLLGIAVDPGWPARPYLYVHYDYAGTFRIHIARFTVGGDLSFTGNGSLTIDPATRYDILTDLPDNANNHNGGTLRFGPDGMLYISLGDDATGCPATDPTVLVGKILRIDVSALPAGGGGPPASGLITPADNPLVNDPNANARLVWMYGLRNPFRFSIDPVSGNLAIGDVGESLREEVDYATVPGSDFGWPMREGDIAGPSSCPGVDPLTFKGPIHVYTHSDGQAVIGGPLYRSNGGPNSFPAAYDGDIFLNDFYSPWLRRLKGSGSSWSLAATPGQPNATDWGSGATWVSDWLETADGAMLYCRMLSGTGSGPGSIRRIRYAAPVAATAPPGGALEFRAPYPSPARDLVALDYRLAADASVRLTVYDVAGRAIRSLIVAAAEPAGEHHVVWDGRDDAGRAVGPGLYLARLSVAGAALERRLVLTR